MTPLTKREEEVGEEEEVEGEEEEAGDRRRGRL